MAGKQPSSAGRGSAGEAGASEVARARRRLWACAVVAAVIGAAAYLPALNNQYALDDVLISSTEADRAHAPLSTLFGQEYFARYNQDTYRPVVTLTTMIDARLGVDARHAGHVQNILWHATTTLLIVLFAGRFVPWRAALVAGLFFALHPGTTESTVSVGYREDSVVACFAVAALSLTWGGRWGPRALALACYALALFTKENAIVFPALLLLARLTLDRDRTLDTRARRVGRALELGAFAIVTGGYLAVRFGPMASPYPFADPLRGSYAATLIATPRLLVHYLRLLVVPWPLVVLYDNVVALDASPLSQLPWLVVDVAFLGGAVWLARARPLLGFGLLWFAVALVPVLHFVPMRVVAADRFVHVSLVGGAFAAGALFALAEAAATSAVRLRAVYATATASLLALLTLTERRIPVWHDDLTLWSDTLRHNPHAYIGHLYLGARYEEAGRIVEARSAYRAATDDCPRDSNFGRVRFCAFAATKLGFLLLRHSDLLVANSAFTEALAFAPDYVPALVGRGHVALALGDVTAARRAAMTAASLHPQLSEVRSMIDELNARINSAAMGPPDLR